MLGLWLLLSLLGGPQADGAARFSARLPLGFPAMTGWERIDGDAHDAHVEVSYSFYVNPEFYGLYQVIRYRLHYLKPINAVERGYKPTEKVVWNATPGRAPLRCFELEGAPGKPGVWREMAHRSPEYLTEMQTVMYLMSLHRTSLRQSEH